MIDSFYIHVEPSKGRPSGVEIVGLAQTLDDPLYVFEGDDCNLTSHISPGFDLSKKIRSDIKNYNNVKIERVTPAIKAIYLDPTGTKFMFKGKLLVEDGDSSSLRERSFQEIRESGDNNNVVRKATHSAAMADDGLVDDLGVLKQKFKKLDLFRGDHQKGINEIEVYCVKNYPCIEQLTTSSSTFWRARCSSGTTDWT